MSTFTFIEAAELGAHQAALEKFESQFTYPIEHVRFSVSHGATYAAYFCSFGQPTFLLVHEGDELVACVAIIRKTIACADTIHNALYIADLKISKEKQMTGLAHRIYLKVTSFIGRQLSARDISFVYFMTWQNHHADFTKVKQALSPLRLFEPIADLAFFLVNAQALAQLPADAFNQQISGTLLDLSPEPKMQAATLIDLRGKKDFYHDGQRLNVAHIALKPNTSDLIMALRQAGNEAAQRGYTYCSFALDTQRALAIDWLSKQGIVGQSAAKAYGLAGHGLLKSAPYTVLVGTYQL